MMRILRWPVVVLMLTASALAAAKNLHGLVVGVTDGETLTVNAAGRKSQIHILGIAAPALTNAYGRASKNALAALVMNRNVNVDWKRRDRYGHIWGKVVVPNNPNCQGPGCPGSDVALKQLATGMAWLYRRFLPEESRADRSAYVRAQFNAKIHRLGVWSSPYPRPEVTLRHEPR